MDMRPLNFIAPAESFGLPTSLPNENYIDESAWDNISSPTQNSKKEESLFSQMPPSSLQKKSLSLVARSSKAPEKENSDSYIQQAAKKGQSLFSQILSSFSYKKKNFHQSIIDDISRLENRLVTLTSQVEAIKEFLKNSPDLLKISESAWKEFSERYMVTKQDMIEMEDLNLSDPVDKKCYLQSQILEQERTLGNYQKFIRRYPHIEAIFRASLNAKENPSDQYERLACEELYENHVREEEYSTPPSSPSGGTQERLIFSDDSQKETRAAPCDYIELERRPAIQIEPEANKSVHYTETAIDVSLAAKESHFKPINYIDDTSRSSGGHDDSISTAPILLQDIDEEVHLQQPQWPQTDVIDTEVEETCHSDDLQQASSLQKPVSESMPASPNTALPTSHDIQTEGAASHPIKNNSRMRKIISLIRDLNAEKNRLLENNNPELAQEYDEPLYNIKARFREEFPDENLENIMESLSC